MIKCDQHAILGWANTLRLWGQSLVLYVVNTLCQVWSKILRKVWSKLCVKFGQDLMGTASAK